MSPASPEPIRRPQQELLLQGAKTGVAKPGAFIDERSEASAVRASSDPLPTDSPDGYAATASSGTYGGAMKARLTMEYDRADDVLTLGTIKPYAGQETEELDFGVIARRNPKTGEIENL